MKSTLFIVSIIIILMAGCNGASERSVSATQTDNTPSDTPTHAVTPGWAPTATTEPRIITHCLDIEDEEVALQEVAHNGTVVVSGITENANPSLLDLQTGIRYSIPLVQEHKYAVFAGINPSPDGDHLAYLEIIRDENNETIENRVYVVNARGEIEAIKTIFPDILNSEWHWLDNERLEFNTRQTMIDGTVSIFYPFTNDWVNISNELPTLLTGPSFDIHHPSWLVDYNSSLERAIYIGDLSGGGLWGLILRDISAQKTIWKSSDDRFEVDIPKWSSSGNELAVLTNGMLYVIDYNNQIKQIPMLDIGSDVMEFSWSPDGRFLALIVTDHATQRKWYLEVYDYQSDQIIDYCQKEDIIFSSFPPPIWSADSQKFVYVMNDSWAPILVDINQESAYRLVDESYPFIWMNSMP